MTREISLTAMIEQFDMAGKYFIQDDSGEFLDIGKPRVATMENIGDGYMRVKPEGETRYNTLYGNYYTQKGLRYMVLMQPSTEEKSLKGHCHITYPYVFKDLEGNIIKMDEFFKGEPKKATVNSDIWTL